MENIQKNERYQEEFLLKQHSGTSVPIHFHRNIEIYGVVRGEVTVVISGEGRILSEGQMAVIDSLESHSYQMKGDAEVFQIHIGKKYLRDYYLIYPNRKLPHWLMDKEHNKKIYENVKQLLSDEEKMELELRRYGFSCELFADIIEKCETKEKRSLSVQDEELMVKLIEFIYQNYSEKITLNSLAETFYISPKTLSKKISKFLNKDLRVFINDVRVDRVLFMKDEPEYKNKTLNELIELCGFDNIRTFYRSYSRIYKKSHIEEETSTELEVNSNEKDADL